jgi:hypothetical protein
VISCTEFIPAYSELFKFLERKGGKAAVTAYWQRLSDTGLDALRDRVAAKGLRGCYEYWTHTLNEEAADFTMTLDEDAGVFTIDMHYCPSKGRLLEFRHLEPYHDYCGHCDLLYRKVLEPMGYRYDMDLSRCGKAACTLTVRRK